MAATTTPRVILVMFTQFSDRVATRIQGLTLWTSRMKLHKVMKITDLTSVALYKIRKRAIDQGFNSKIDSRILASTLVTYKTHHDLVDLESLWKSMIRL